MSAPYSQGYRDEDAGGPGIRVGKRIPTGQQTSTAPSTSDSRKRRPGTCTGIVHGVDFGRNGLASLTFVAVRQVTGTCLRVPTGVLVGVSTRPTLSRGELSVSFFDPVSQGF